MDGNANNLTYAQKEILEKFKFNMKDILTPEYTDKILIKWLKAKNFNVKQAEKIFRDNYYNRILAGVNTMLDTYKKPEVLEKYEAFGILGFAKNGSFIRYLACGRFDFYGFINSVSCLDICLYCSYIFESDIRDLKEQSLKTGKEVDEIIWIVDFEGFSIQQVLHKCVFEMGLEAARLLQDCYPGIFSKLLIVNAPPIYGSVLNLFKPVLRSHVLEKMFVANKGSTRELLLEHIDEDVLPVFLGGKRVDSNGDPKCREFIKFGGKFPEKYYGVNRQILLSPTDPGVTCVTIGPRSTYNYVQVVKDEASRVRIQHRFENGSLSIVLLYKKCDPNSDTLVLPKEDDYIDENDEDCEFKQVSVSIRPQAHCCPEDGIVTLSWPGIFVLKYSNAGNWFTSRKLIFKCTPMPPKSDILS